MTTTNEEEAKGYVYTKIIKVYEETESNQFFDVNTIEGFRNLTALFVELTEDLYKMYDIKPPVANEIYAKCMYEIQQESKENVVKARDTFYKKVDKVNASCEHKIVLKSSGVMGEIKGSSDMR